jgi:hypothetical protein
MSAAVRREPVPPPVTSPPRHRARRSSAGGNELVPVPGNELFALSAARSSSSPEGGGGERAGEGKGEILPIGSPPLQPRSPNVNHVSPTRERDGSDMGGGDANAHPRRGRPLSERSKAFPVTAPLAARVPASLAHLHIGVADKLVSVSGAGDHVEPSPPHSAVGLANYKTRRPRRLSSFARPPDPLPAPATNCDLTLPPLGPNTSPLRNSAGVSACSAVGGERHIHAPLRGGGSTTPGVCVCVCVCVRAHVCVCV